MDKIEKALKNKENQYKNLNAPDNFEQVIRSKLETTKQMRKSLGFIRVASILIAIIVIGYNSSTLAFYGKSLFGYENIMSETLIGLSELGEGQRIDKTYYFSDGVYVKLDMVMLDGNGLVLFYTIEDSTKTKNIEDINIRPSITGLLYRTNLSGIGEMNMDEFSQKWVLTSSDAPRIYNQVMTLELDYLDDDSGISQSGEIKFKLDRNKAVGKTIKFTVNQELEVLGRTINIEKISASSVSTIVSGKLQNIISLGADYLKGERIFFDNIEFILLADGKNIEKVGAGMSTNENGVLFDQRFEAIPKETKNISLVLEELTIRKNLNLLVAIDFFDQNKVISLEGEEILIERIAHVDGQTHLTISSSDHIRIPGVGLEIEGKTYQLLNTIDEEFIKIENGEVKNRRTLVFDGIGDNYHLNIKHLIYSFKYSKEIYYFNK